MRLTGRHPFNCEPPPARLFESYIPPPSLHYVRNHGAVPRIPWEQHRLAINGAGRCGRAGGAWSGRQHARPGRARCARPSAPTLSMLAGLVDSPTTFTMDDLLRLPSVDVTCTLTCAGALPLRRRWGLRRCGR